MIAFRSSSETFCSCCLDWMRDYSIKKKSFCYWMQILSSDVLLVLSLRSESPIIRLRSLSKNLSLEAGAKLSQENAKLCRFIIGDYVKWSYISLTSNKY